MEEVFRRRALVSGAVSGVVAMLGLLVTRNVSPQLWHGMLTRAWPFAVLSAVGGVASLWTVARRRYRLARVAAAVAVASVVAGWGVAQWPYLDRPRHDGRGRGCPRRTPSGRSRSASRSASCSWLRPCSCCSGSSRGAARRAARLVPLKRRNTSGCIAGCRGPVTLVRDQCSGPATRKSGSPGQATSGPSDGSSEGSGAGSGRGTMRSGAHERTRCASWAARSGKASPSLPLAASACRSSPLSRPSRRPAASIASSRTAYRKREPEARSMCRPLRCT